MQYLVGLDVGTTSTRTLIIDSNGKLISSCIKEYPMHTPKPGWAEQDPDDWWEAAVYTIKGAISSGDIKPQDIAAIGLTGQMHGSVFIDRKGSIIRPALLWCDQRTAPQCEKIYDIFGYEGFIKLSHNKALAGFTAPKILWLAENEPQNYKKIYKLLLPKDYIRYKLSGEFFTEVTDASGTILMDIEKRDWSEEILKGLDIDRAILPDMFESIELSSFVSEEAAKLTGLIKGTPIAGGGGDQPAGAVGSGIVKEGIVSDSLGTSGVVFTTTDDPVYDEQGRLHSFCHSVPGKWNLMGVTLSASGSFKWYADKFGPSREIKEKNPQIPDYALLDKQAEIVKEGSEGLIFLPYLTGERTPYADPNARGVFFGISYVHTQDHFVRSILEGVAFSQLDCLNLIRGLDVKPDRVIFFGGGAKSRLWSQMMSDVFELEISTLKIEEGPAYGAALIAAVGAKLYSSIEEVCEKTIEQKEVFKPDPEKSRIYSKYYEIYKDLYKDLKKDFKRLEEV